MNKAVLLDRDGTINVDHGYMHDATQIEFLEGALEAMQGLCAAGYLLVIITNQSGIGRGYFTVEQYRAFSEAFDARLRSEGVEIAATYMCPHAPTQECSCRKPHPYMALQALEELQIEPALSYMFGDKPSDVECGVAAGLTARLISGEQNLLYWTKEILENRL